MLKVSNNFSLSTWPQYSVVVCNNIAQKHSLRDCCERTIRPVNKTPLMNKRTQSIFVNRQLITLNPATLAFIFCHTDARVVNHIHHRRPIIYCTRLITRLLTCVVQAAAAGQTEIHGKTSLMVTTAT